MAKLWGERQRRNISPSGPEMRGGVGSSRLQAQPIAIAQQPVAPAPAGSQTKPQKVIVADDVDVIERQWVNIAKKILVDNTNDPFKKAEAVIGLKTDYLEKRFGF